MQNFDKNNPYADNVLIEERKFHGSRKVIAKQQSLNCKKLIQKKNATNQ